ncbi:DUF4157 domain-containing protein [uncultured Aquimarina sp.]|uniref:eCIS core domain-containing protein n=1 Tax=uncultured Aquimarina sp. TaxID=575652 RepID=UPI00261BC042|nr:DUF4157 domain-containing protein [uncultured Aquimarina sp.]
MKAPQENTHEPQKEPIQRVQQENSIGGEAAIADNRPATIVQRKLRSGIDSSENTKTPIQRKANNTGLPDNLKSGIENLSGYSMDDVKVHYNSSKPAQLQAHAYAQGTDIHLASGQEKHLAHEAWHVVQQKQGRVQPTKQLKSRVNINEDSGLEKEADIMGAKALQLLADVSNKPVQLKTSTPINSNPIQRYKTKNNGLTVAGEFHNKTKEQNILESQFVKSVKGASAEVWTENIMPGSNTGTYEASEMPEHLVINGVDRVKHYSTLLIDELTNNKIISLASSISIDTAQKTLESALGSIFDDFTKVFSEKKINSDNDPMMALRDLKSTDFYRTMLNSHIKGLSNEDRKEFVSNYDNFRERLLKLSDIVSSYLYIPDGRNISHNFVRSKKMNDTANEKKEVNGVWLIGQYHVQEIQEHLRHNVQYDLVSMKDFNNDMRDYAKSIEEGEMFGNLNNQVGEVSTSARIIKSSLKFFSHLNDQWDNVQYNQEEKVNFEVQRLIEHSRVLNRIQRKDLIAINLLMDKEEKSKIIDHIMLRIKILKKELATVPLLTFIDEFSPGKKRPEFISIILKSISRKSLHELVSDLEKLASVAK